MVCLIHHIVLYVLEEVKHLLLKCVRLHKSIPERKGLERFGIGLGHTKMRIREPGMCAGQSCECLGALVILPRLAELPFDMLAMEEVAEDELIFDQDFL